MDVVCFLCQQCAEKYIKAYLVAQSETLHLYTAQLEGDDLLQEGTYAFITQDRRGTELGLLFGLSYGAEYESFIFGLSASGRTYQHQFRVWNAGLSLGYQF